jgi:hypothetical protein
MENKDALRFVPALYFSTISSLFHNSLAHIIFLSVIEQNFILLYHLGKFHLKMFEINKDVIALSRT